MAPPTATSLRDQMMSVGVTCNRNFIHWPGTGAAVWAGDAVGLVVLVSVEIEMPE